MTNKRKPSENQDPGLVEKKSKLREKKQLKKNEVEQLLLDSQEFGSETDSSGEESTDSKKENVEQGEESIESREENVEKIVDEYMPMIQVIFKKVMSSLPISAIIYFDFIFRQLYQNFLMKLHQISLRSKIIIPKMMTRF